MHWLIGWKCGCKTSFYFCTENWTWNLHFMEKIIAQVHAFTYYSDMGSNSIGFLYLIKFTQMCKKFRDIRIKSQLNTSTTFVNYKGFPLCY